MHILHRSSISGDDSQKGECLRWNKTACGRWSHPLWICTKPLNEWICIIEIMLLAEYIRGMRRGAQHFWDEVARSSPPTFHMINFQSCVADHLNFSTVLQRRIVPWLRSACSCMIKHIKEKKGGINGKLRGIGDFQDTQQRGCSHKELQPDPFIMEILNFRGVKFVSRFPLMQLWPQSM